MFKIHDILSAMEPLYFVSKILGLAPYSYVQTRSGSYVIRTCSISSILWTLFITALMLVLFLHISLFKFLKLSPDLSASYLIVFAFQKISLLSSCVAFLLLGVTTNRNKIRTIMEILSTIDEMLIRHKAGNTYKKEFYTLLVHILFVTSLLTCMFYYYVTEDSSSSNILFSAYYVLTLLINSVGLIQLLFILRILKLSFKITGQELKKLKTNPASKTTFVNFTYPFTENPRRDDQVCYVFALRSLHFRLYELGRTVNSSYGLLMLIETVHNFVSAVSLVDITIFLLDRETYVTTTIYYMCWLAYYAIKTSVLMSTSHLTCAEARKLVATLHKLLLRQDLHDCCERQIRLFITQVINIPVQFTASGIFPFDLPTLHSIASATSMYIIVLQQLKTS